MEVSITLFFFIEVLITAEKNLCYLLKNIILSLCAQLVTPVEDRQLTLHLWHQHILTSTFRTITSTRYCQLLLIMTSHSSCKLRSFKHLLGFRAMNYFNSLCHCYPLLILSLLRAACSTSVLWSPNIHYTCMFACFKTKGTRRNEI